MKTQSSLLTFLLVGATAPVFGQSAWIPEVNQWELTPFYTFQTFDEFWVGTQKVHNPNDGDSLDQHTVSMAAEYGLAQCWALDLTFGFTHTATSAFNPKGGNDTDDGFIDTQVGVRYQLSHEDDPTALLPITLTFRAGAVIQGNYDPNFPFSAGDGGTGGRFSLLWGKNISDTGLSTYGEIGYQTRNHDVPDDFLFSAGIGYTCPARITLNAGYRLIKGLSGPDIGDPGFGVDFGFPQVKEVSHNIEGGIGYTDSRQRFYQFYYARTVDGRNTGEKNLFGFAVTFQF